MQQDTKILPEVDKPPRAIFILMTLTNILINLDHGILPACTNQMKEQYDMDETELGILGSIVYLGIVLMGFFAGRLYQHFDSKLLTVVALVCLEGSLVLFVLSDHKVTAYISRFFTGVCQVFMLVYYPIWIDKFGGNKKTIWLTLLQICVPIGIFIGYGMTAVILSTNSSYKNSFYIQIGMVTCFIGSFLFLSKDKLDSRRNFSQDLTENLLFAGAMDTLLSSHEIAQEKKQRYRLKFMVEKLIKSKMYLVGTFTMSAILFVSTGIQFWLTDYYINVLHFDRGSVNIAYAIVSITGPTTGCAFGGFVTSKIGGYDSPRAVYYVFIFSCIGIGSALFIPFIDQFYTLCVLLWLVLYFGGAMMPGLTGIMMSSVSPYLRAFGNSNGQIIKNILGYLPSPFIYGLFNSLLGDRAGITFLMFWGLWAPVLTGYGSLHKYNQLKKLRVVSEAVKEEQEKQVYSDAQDEGDTPAQKKIKVEQKCSAGPTEATGLMFGDNQDKKEQQAH